MCRYFVLLACFICGLQYFFTSAASAQENTAISLPHSYTSSDTLQISALNNRGKELRWEDSDSAFFLFQEAARLSRNVGFLDGIGLSLSNLAVILMDSGKYDASLFVFRQALPYCLQAVHYKRLPATLYNNMGNVYFAYGAYANAAYYYYAAVKALGNDTLSSLRISAYSNLGAIHIRMGQPHQALYYFRQGEIQARNQKDDFRLSFTLNNKGDALVALNEYAKAIGCYQEALQLARKERQTDVEQAVEVSMGELMLRLDKPAEAIGHLHRALDQSVMSADNIMMIQLYYNMGTAYYRLNDFQRAKKFLIPALQKAEALGLLDNVSVAHETLASLYEHTGDYPSALKHQRLYSLLRDSLLHKEKTEVVNQLEIKYNIARKDRELIRNQLLIARQKHQIKEKNTLIGIVSLGVLLLTALSLFLWMLYRNNQHKQQIQGQLIRTMEKEKEIAAREEEIRLMQALIQGEEKERTRIARELHDGIGGMLAAIQMHFSAARNRQHGVVQENNMNEIMKMLENTADEVRKTSHNLMPDILIKHSFKEALHLYGEQIKSGNTLQIDLQIHGEITPLPKSVELSLYRIIQELIQNIIKHAEATQAIIQVNQQETVISIMIEDNGAGFRSGDDYTGIGLRNLKSRVQALQGFLSIESAEGAGTTVYIEFETEKLNRTVSDPILLG